jgi:ATP-dependent RNA helicase DeaD
MAIPKDAIAAPLAAALDTRGYEALTPVQQAMLAEDVAGRDLLVSAQTGSGKTVAFGLAIAPDLLAGADRLPLAEKPLALVIAPTRELALQVARELDWLYAETGALIATCVGGMDYRSERRALDRGADVVVGTPGRLRDHLERGSLDLGALRAAVLDEADEMLDLGFREDLEFILSAAPAERRTLMFSATVPAAIAELAKTFQRDALRIQTQGEARQHVDIEYRALSVPARDREPAIFNLLRFYEARTAIVFCKTRMAVNHLFARMGNRGFQAVALSGELGQQERTHALQSLRDGRARVCIATDVAARGIDLPGLDLVIHADLPANPETLLHRSGRTGRAGQKGVSALIVTPSEFRKAQRLLQGARVVAEWGTAPSAEQVAARDEARLLDHPALEAPPSPEEAPVVAALIGRYGADRVAAAFARLWREGHSAPEELSDAAGAAPAAPRPRADLGASVWFSIPLGRASRAEARWLLPRICEAGGITKDGVGAIRVQEDETFVQIALADAARFGAGLELEPGVSLSRIEGEPVLEARAAPRANPRERDGGRSEAPRDRARPAAAPPLRPDRLPGARPLRAEPPRKAYVKRDAATDAGPRQSYPSREDGARAPQIGREPSGGSPRARRAEGPAKPYPKRAEGGGKPRSEKQWGEKPRARRADGPKPPPGARPTAAPTAAGRTDAPRKPFAERDGDAPGAAARKPRWKAGAEAASRPVAGDPAASRPKSAGFKPGGAKPGGVKPGSHKSAGFKSAAGKPGGKPAAPRKPAPRPADPADTSRRYTPPRKPKA